MNVTNVSSKEEFDSYVKKAPAVAVHFWASWCEPCSHMDAVFKELAAENPPAVFLRVEAEELPEVSEKYEVSAVPFFLFFKGGSLVDRLEGANAPELANKVMRHVAAATSVDATSAGPQPGPSTTGSAAALTVIEEVLKSTQKKANHGGPALTPGLKSRIETLLGSHEVILFMKGNPEAPRCGFSSKVVNVLKELGLDFESFDIFSDEEVRQGLKEYSQWPTFPQLYCKGELVGGCDIVLEMHKSGELKKFFEEEEVLPGKKKALEKRLKGLLSSSKTMLFMKGTPDAPRCGFSRKVVEALRESEVQFGSFDILSDEEVRQGLKELSDWPTFPQLYHEGELVGGCDIVLEMHAKGELKEALAA